MLLVPQRCRSNQLGRNPTWHLLGAHGKNREGATERLNVDGAGKTHHRTGCCAIVEAQAIPHTARRPATWPRNNSHASKARYAAGVPLDNTSESPSATSAVLSKLFIRIPPKEIQTPAGIRLHHLIQAAICRSSRPLDLCRNKTSYGGLLCCKQIPVNMELVLIILVLLFGGGEYWGRGRGYW